MSEPTQKLLGRPPLPDGEAADAQIHLRTKVARKGAYNAAARRARKTLARWMTDVCDEAAGYKE